MKLTQLTEQKERPYICVHAKKGKHETHAVSSYDAAKNAAKHWGMKSTAGIDAHLAEGNYPEPRKMEVTQADKDNNTEAWKRFKAGDPRYEWKDMILSKAESYDDYHGDMSKEEYDKTVKGSQMEYTVWVGGTEVNDKWLNYEEAKELYDLWRAKGYDDVQLDARLKEGSFWGRDDMVAKMKKDELAAGMRKYRKDTGTAHYGTTTSDPEKWKELEADGYEWDKDYYNDIEELEAKWKAKNEGAKPDFLDLDKDGDKKEPMKKAAKDKKAIKEENEDSIDASYSNDGKTITIADYQPEGMANAHKKFNLRKQIHRGENGKLITSPWGGYKVSFHGDAEDVKAYAEHHLGESMNENVKPIEGDFDWANSMTDGTLKNLRHAMDNDWDVLKGIKDLADFKRTIDIFFTNEETPVPEDIAKIFNKLLARDEKNIAKFNEFIRRAFVDAGEELEELDTMFEGTDGCDDCDWISKETDGDIDTCDECAAEKRQTNEAEKRWKQTSMSPEEAIEKYGKENVKVKKGALRNGDDMVEVNEAGGYYTHPVYDMIKQHGYPKVMHRLLSALDADVIQDFISRESDLNEAVNEDEEAIAARDEFLKVMDMKPKSGNKAIDTIKQIVADKQNMQVKFDDGKMRVDLYTASAVSQVYDAVKPETQVKIDNMLRTKAGMLKMSDFAFSKFNEGIKEGKRIDEILPKAIGQAAKAVGGALASKGVKGQIARGAAKGAVNGMIKDKSGKQHNVNSPQGKMIANMGKKVGGGAGASPSQVAQAKKDLMKNKVKTVGTKVKNFATGALAKAAGDSGFGNPLAASKQHANDMVEQAMKKAQELDK